MFFGGVRGRPDWRCLQDDCRCKGKGYLEFVPTLQLHPVFHRNVKAKDCGSGFESQNDRALFCDVFRAPWTVDREGGIAAVTDVARQFGQCAKAASGTGSTGCAISQSLNALRDRFSIQIHACHDDNATASPVIRGWENSSMPEGEYRAISGLINLGEVGVSDRLPANGSAD